MSKPFAKIGPRYTPGLDARTNIQGARVGHGVKTGALDGKEMNILQDRRQVYQGMLASSKFDDGVIDGQERVAAHKFMNNTSKLIYDFKHNDHNANRPGNNGSIGNGKPGKAGNGQKGVHEFTDKEGNTVTRTPDGYTSIVSEDGATTTTLTPGGYKVEYNSETSDLSMTDLKSGESTSVWGDPHVSESDESGDYWNYDSSTSTFVLADGTKVTTEAESADGVLTSVDVYSGTGRTHVHSDSEGNNYTAGDRFRADAMQDDGDRYFGNLRANDWYADSRLGEEVQSENTGWDGLPYYAA